MATSSNCKMMEHPVLQHNLTMLRNKKTPAAAFRRIMSEMSCLMAYEVSKNLKTKKTSVETPFERVDAQMIEEKLILVPILRAGYGMLEGMQKLLPFARVGHVGIYRDKNINSTVEYYFRLPNQPEGQRVLLIDPLLATGDTAIAAIDRLKQYQVGSIELVCILAAPQGLEALQSTHPDVQVHCISVEKSLDEKGYIRPGLGDAGDRLYDTFEILE